MGSLGNWLIGSPAGLAAGLLALAIPWLIHWISRSRGKRVLIGSTQLVRQARRRLVHELRLTQWLLLLVRSLMVVVAALILGRLAMPGQEQVTGDAAYVTPGWLATAETRDLESLGFFSEARVLAPGFPPVSQFDPGVSHGDLDAWPLLAERLSSAAHAGAVHVFSLDRLAGFGEFAPALPNPVIWHGLEAAVTPSPGWALQVVVVTDGASGERGLAVEQALSVIRKHRVPGLRWQLLDSPRELDTNGYDAVIWASDDPLAAATNPQGSARLVDLGKEPWAQEWSGAEFPQHLLEALLSDEQVRYIWADSPVLNAATTASTRVMTHREHLPRRSLQTWLAVFLMLLWGIERWLAERRGREQA
jgi:hypothetical protein